MMRWLRLLLILPMFFASTLVSAHDSLELAESILLKSIDPSLELVAERSSVEVIGEYLFLGVEHILGGFDHLLFVLGLIVVAKTPKRIILTMTGFTLAHSVTLVLSTLDLIHLPIVPVEIAIAVSILFLAFEISREEHKSLTFQYPLLVASGFGLLHGLGFASALTEVGLAPSEILLSLVFFNVGVELGQLIFIALVLSGFVLLRRAGTYSSLFSLSSARSIVFIDLLVAYIIGVPAAYWVFERVFSIF